MNAEDISKIDFSKIFMGIAVAIVFILQQYFSMKLEDVKATIVPRKEITKTVMDKEDILQALQSITDRLDAMEGK